MPATRLFSGASFIFAEFTDISFEVKAVLCLDFYAFRDVFRRSRRFEFLYNQRNRLERKRLFPRNLTYLHQTLFSLQSRHLWWFFFMPRFYPINGKDLHRFCHQTENIHKCGIFSKSGVFCIVSLEILCFYFYAFGDVFRRSRRFEFLYNQCNRLERKRLFPKN